MKKLWISFFVFILIFIFYFLFSPLKVYKNKIYYIDDSFSTKITSNKLSDIDGYFYLDKECGYFSTSNGMHHYKESLENEFVLANKYFYLTYQKVGDLVKVFSSNGELISEINAVGYPYLLKEYPVIFLLKTNAMGFSLFTMNGEKIIDEIDFTSMITSISMDKNSNILISTFSGDSYIFSINGDKKFESIYQDSKINVSKSSTVDVSGKNIAVCSGLYPEVIEIFETETGTMVDKIKTETNFRYSTYLRFFKDRLYYEGNNEIKYYNYIKKKRGSIKTNGVVSEINFDSTGNILVLTVEDSLYCLTIYSPDGEKKYYKEFSSPVSNFENINSNLLYFKLSDLIIKIKYGFAV